MTKYQISKGSWCFNEEEFGENMLGFGRGDYGIIVDENGCGVDDEDVSEALEENEEFVKAAEEEGYDTSFTELNAYEVYKKMTGLDDESLIMDFDDGYYETIQPFYDNFRDQVENVRSYVNEDERINILEDNCSDDLDINYLIECDEDTFNEVKAFLDKSNSETENKNSTSLIHKYSEKKFNTPIFKATYSNPGSLRVEIEKE